MDNKNAAGFSLVELSVTLVIAGMIMAAITSGLHLMQAAKLDKVISEISGYVTAVNNFKDKYKAWPGDMPNATSFWGTYPTNTAGTVNGDGDEQIKGSTTTEPLYAWRQLTLAGMIAGDYTAVTAGTPTFQPGINVPSSSIEPKGSYYYLYYHGGKYNGTSGNALDLTNNDTNTSPWGSAVKPADLHILDNKIDDGLADGGNIYAVRSVLFAGVSGKCVDADEGAAAANYILSDNVVSCRMFYWLNKL